MVTSTAARETEDDLESALSVIATPALPGNQCRRFRVPGDVAQRAFADLPPEQRKLGMWLHGFCHKNDFSAEELGRVLKKPSGQFYSSDSVLQLLRGDRIRKGEPVDTIIEAIRPLHDLESRREALANSGFIATRLYHEVERRCDRARERQRILFIFGDSQIGKTTCLRQYQRTHNHGQTIYVEMPTGGSLGKFTKALAKAFNIPAGLKIDAIQERILDALDSSVLLVLDEMHRCLQSRTLSSGLATFSFIREIWNRCQCGIVISMTNEGRKELLTGHHAAALKQIWRRRITPLQLPDVTPADDLALFAAAYGLPPADDQPVTVRISYLDGQGREKTSSHTETPAKLQAAVNETEGLGVWISILQDAADMAKEQNRAITWGAVIKANCQAQAEARIFQ